MVGLVGLPQQQRRRPVVGDARARGRSADRGRRRSLRTRAGRRGGDPGGAGTAATGRGRAPRRAAARGSSARPRDRCASPESSSPSRHPRNTTSPVEPSALAAARCSSWRRATSAAVSAVDVPRALRAVGAHDVMDGAAGGRPLRQRAAGAELDVVGMCADGERDRGRGQVEASASAHVATRLSGLVAHGRCAHRSAETAGWSRSDGRSTSQPSRGSRTTRNGRPAGAPRRRAARNDPGP